MYDNREKKQCFLSSGRDGFTLVELITAVAILGTLAAFLVPMFSDITSGAQETVLNSNMTSIAKMVAVYSVDYRTNTLYGYYSEDGTGTLNNFIEHELEVMRSGHYANSINLVNPYNKNESILDYNNTLSSGDGYRPALFLTANDYYSYASTRSTANIVGSIVVYFEVDGTGRDRRSVYHTNYMEIYYVKEDGTKSGKMIQLT